MSKLVCNHCKAELTLFTLNNIKNVKFGRTHEMVDGKEVDIEKAYIECSKCGNITETDSEEGHKLRCNLVSMWIAYGYDILYNFEDIKDLLEHLSDIDIEKVKDCKFKVFLDCLDDDSGDVYYDITIFKDDTEIGSIDMLRHSNIPWGLDISELIEYDDKPSYSYRMKLNKDFSSKETGDPFNNSDGGFGIKGK